MSVWWKKMGARDWRRFLREVRFGRENLIGWKGWEKFAGLAFRMARSLLEFVFGLMKKVPVGGRVDGVMAFRERRS
jgi:hypothetical protein